jgi:hypothetical protein
MALTVPAHALLLVLQLVMWVKVGRGLPLRVMPVDFSVVFGNSARERPPLRICCRREACTASP